MRRVLFVSIFAGLFAATPAHAQEDPRQDRAVAPFNEGLRLHDEGREAAALEKFREAYEIYPSPNVLFQIARSEELLGRYADALRHYREALKSPLLHPQNRELGATYIASLEARVARVEVRGPAGMVVTLLGEEHRLPLDAPIELDTTGPVGATGLVGAERYEGHTMATAGGLAVLEMTPVEGGAGPAPSAEPLSASPEPVRSGSFWGWRSVTGFALIGAGAAAFVTTAVLASSESSHDERAREIRATLPPGNSVCASASASPACEDLAREILARDDARIGKQIALPIGVVAAGAGAALVASSLLWPHPQTRPSVAVTPVVGPGLAAGGVRVSF